MTHLFYSVIRETTALVPILIMSIILMCVTFILQRYKGDNYTCAYYDYANNINVSHAVYLVTHICHTVYFTVHFHK